MPDHVAGQRVRIVLQRPQAQDWAGDPPVLLAVLRIVVAVDPEAGPIVLDHAVDGHGIVNRLAEIGIGLLPLRSADAPYQASGSAPIARSGLSGWP